MRTTNPLRARLAAALSALAVAVTGTVVLAAAPAEAKIRVTDYGYQTIAFGTQAKSQDLMFNSGRTAYSYIRCTRLTGLNATNRDNASDFVSELNLPSADDPMLTVRGVKSTSATFQAHGIKGTRSVNTIAEVVLGRLDGPHLVIKDLTTTAKAWADKSGKLHARSDVSTADIVPHTGVAEVDDLFAPVADGSSQLIGLIQGSDSGSYEIPGIGTLSLGASTPLDSDVTSRYAQATATILRVQLEQTNTVVTIGHSAARINTDLPVGVMHGQAYGADIPAGLGGVVKVGRLGLRVLPCQGTYGKERVTSLVGLSLPATDQLAFGQLKGIALGVQQEDGYALAQTTGKLASLTFGPLRLEGVVARATVVRKPSGKVRTSIGGSSIGRLVIDGQELPAPGPGDVIELPNGLGKVTFFATQRSPRDISVTAAKIELLQDFQGAAAGTVVRIGNARAGIARN